MPLRYVLDENLRAHQLWLAVLQHNATGVDPLDAGRVGDPADLPLGSSDPDILLWAEQHDRILVSRDWRTMPRHLADHLASDHHSPGIFQLRRHAYMDAIIDFLVYAAYSSDADDWTNAIEPIP